MTMFRRAKALPLKFLLRWSTVIGSIRSGWEWLADMRGPLAFAGVFLRAARDLLSLVLLWDAIRLQPPTWGSYLAFWILVVVAAATWFISYALDAEGDGPR